MQALGLSLSQVEVIVIEPLRAHSGMLVDAVREDPWVLELPNRKFKKNPEEVALDDGEDDKGSNGLHL